MTRSIISVLFLMACLAGPANAQTASKAPQSDSEKSETKKADTPKKPGTTKNAETVDKKGQDIDSFFKDAEKQYLKDGQSCSPPPEPIV